MSPMVLCTDVGTVRKSQRLPQREDVDEPSRALLDILDRVREGDASVMREGIARHSHACRNALWPVLAQACPFILQIGIAVFMGIWVPGTLV